MTSSAKGDADRHCLAARFVDGPHRVRSRQSRATSGGLARRSRSRMQSGCDRAISLTRFPPRQNHSAGHRRSLALSVRSGSRRCRARCSGCLNASRSAHLAQLIETTCREVVAASGEAEAMRLLRRMKSEAALLIALCDIGGVWPVMQVTAALTDLAVASVQSALRYLLRQEAARGRLSPPNPDRPEDDSGLVVLAMGKMGAGELNYSSDIDLIVFFDSERADAGAAISSRSRSSCASRRRCRGCCSSAPATATCSASICGCGPIRPRRQVAISTAAALHYYEREGRTWERAAMIKARPCAGDRKAGEALVAEIAPFVWRKHLDFAALADVHDMKRQMQTYRGQSEIAVEGHNVKIGRGGIREIEFFAQTQQLIAGGRHPELRVRPTLEALEGAGVEQLDHLRGARRNDGGLSSSCAGSSTGCRWSRTSRPTRCPTTSKRWSASRVFSAMTAAPPSPGICSAISTSCRGITASCSRAIRPAPRSCRPADYSAGPDDPRLLEHLAALGFKKPITVAQTVQQWMVGDYRVFRVEVDAERLCRVRSRADRRPCATPKSPTTRVTAFDRFLQALQRGGRLISLLSQNRDLVALVALILGAAPRLGDMLARQPQIMDGLIDPRFFGAMPDQRELSARLAATLSGCEFLRGVPRPPAAVRPGKPVPDRHANPVRHGLRPAGQRRLRRRRRGHRRYRAWPGDRPVRGPARPDQGPGDRDPRDGQARQPRDDGLVRSRSDPAL